MPFFTPQNPAGQPLDLFNPTGIATVSNVLVSGGLGSISGAAGTPLLANPTRRAWGISNFGTGILLVSLSATPPTTGNVHIVLSSGLSVYDGLGGRYIENPANYCGPVSVSGAVPNLNVLYTAWQL
jgi:hypothetical protein